MRDQRPAIWCLVWDKIASRVFQYSWVNIKIVEALNRLQWDAPHWRPKSWLCRLLCPFGTAIVFLYFKKIIHLNPDGACVNASEAKRPTKSGKYLKLIRVTWPVKKRIIPGVCVVLELFYNIADCSQDLLFPFKALLPLMWHLVKVWVGSLWPFTTLCPSPFSPISSLPQHNRGLAELAVV